MWEHPYIYVKKTNTIPQKWRIKAENLPRSETLSNSLGRLMIEDKTDLRRERREKGLLRTPEDGR